MLIIYNPAAGRRRAALLWHVLDHLVTSGMRIEIAETLHAGHATELAQVAAEKGHSIVVAAGGDGTIAEVTAGLAGTRAALGIIPLGTANVLAHELGLVITPRGVAAALAFGRTRPLWPGVASRPAGDQLFVQMLGVGLDAQVVHNISRPMKRWLGRSAYVVQTGREMARYEYKPVKLQLDGVAEEVASAIICKGRLYGGNYPLALNADPSRAGFEVALFDRAGSFSTLVYGAALPLKLLPRAPGLRFKTAHEIEFTSEGLPAQADGDAVGVTPLTVRDAAGPVSVVIG